MPSAPLYPSTQAEFVVWFGNLAANVAISPPAVGVSTAQSTALTAINTTLQSTFALAMDESTRTHVAIVNKDVALKAAKREAKNIANIVRAFPTITPGQLAMLGIPLPAARQVIQPPTQMAKIDVLSTDAFGLRVKVHGVDSPAVLRAAGVMGCVVMSYVGPTPPSDPRDWKLEGTTSKSVFDITYPTSIEPGSIIWVAAYYVNGKLQNGPMTYPPVSVRLAGSVIPPEESAAKLAA